MVLARKGLARRARLDALGRDETRFLDPLDRIIEAGRAPAEVMLEKSHGAWGGRDDPVYDEYAL
jgi:glutamate--cysteine ligase